MRGTGSARFSKRKSYHSGCVLPLGFQAFGHLGAVYSAPRPNASGRALATVNPAAPRDRPAASIDAAEVQKFDALAGRFWDPEGEFKPLHELNPVRLGFIRERAALAGRAVLDVGCGGGILAEALAREGAAVTGIDLAAAAIATAELHALEGGIRLQYRVASAEALAAESPAAFDVVTCMEMLEHVPEPASVIAALAQLVRPGGSVFVSTLNRTPRAFLTAIVGAEYLARLLPRGTHEYARFIRPSELARAARAAGLEVRELKGLGYDLWTRRFRLEPAVDVNYLAHLVRPAGRAP
ncbi:MAG: bifunctional 2-polyprenyl-6-hydroxyphenol methylase/3-demethylubiquinol 3-O-methyltransferase UbiG [Proteobacteria bacterium]|nr:bifunctional 2-polyprenyl-6-hydroxyphenol methylase/3-demethylubiquinol 3-O-methyltransferase UbiG [Pseudomonadota bacterium]